MPLPTSTHSKQIPLKHGQAKINNFPVIVLNVQTFPIYLLIVQCNIIINEIIIYSS